MTLTQGKSARGWPDFSRPVFAPGFSRECGRDRYSVLQPASAGLAKCYGHKPAEAGSPKGSKEKRARLANHPLKWVANTGRLKRTNHLRSITRLLVLGMGLFTTACAQPQRALLVPPEPPVVWPKPPDAPHVRYLGELKTSADLHAAKPAGRVWREILYGPQTIAEMVKPHSVAISADGNRLAVADTDIACVHVFDLATRQYRRIENWGGPEQRFACPTGVAWDGATLWVADAKLHGVVVVGSGGAGKLIGTDVLKRPAGLAVHVATGRVYVADAGAHAVVAFDRQGHEVLRFGHQGSAPGEFNYPGHISVAPDGTLIVADTLNFRVQRFAADGTPLGTFGRKGDAAGDFSLPKGVAAGADGNIWVVDANFENVQAFTPAGQLLMAFGQEGQKPGDFWLPAGICIDARGRMWIADTYNRRVQVFELLP
jgi:sugar lactone lactonase YvrE